MELPKSPQQAIFDEVFKTSLDQDYETYDYLPASSAGYPFVFVGEQINQDLTTKSVIYGTVVQTIHIFHNRKNRRDLTDMMNALQYHLRRLKSAANYRISIRNINQQVLLDTSTAETLLHGIIEVEFQFN
ncbi:hypothetical protein [Paraliobacillus ryukyuensis]|uniref:hypothetical protein n=1 Tax=Paraliobacillus ryukyuensis TaxID=200904 RepID=UPI0009A5E325|nr:hypothetical protein [Paraliobacillus ryukyuensis]